MLRSMFLWASENAWLARSMPRLGFVRRAVRRFMPGEDLESALAATADLGALRMGTVLTLLGENVKDRSDTDGVVSHYLEVIEAIHARRLDSEVSLKLTHLGLDLDPGLAAENLARIVSRAAERGQDVAVDMEGSALVDRTLETYRRVKAAHGNVGLCLQSYLRRTEGDLESLLPLRPMIRLVKGAYAEPATIAFPEKAQVDAEFLKLARRLIRAATSDGQPRVVFGTHDRRLIGEINRWAGAEGIPRDAYEFHLLYGIGREEQRRLVDEGYRVRVLVSYGAAWFPWYMRRLAERPANVGFVLRSMLSR